MAQMQSFVTHQVGPNISTDLCQLRHMLTLVQLEPLTDGSAGVYMSVHMCMPDTEV